MEPIVGASTCASGNQIWKGNIGILTAKGIKKNIHKKICSSEVRIMFSRTSYSVEAVKVYKYKIPNNKKKDPNKV